MDPLVEARKKAQQLLKQIDDVTARLKQQEVTVAANAEAVLTAKERHIKSQELLDELKTELIDLNEEL